MLKSAGKEVYVDASNDPTFAGKNYYCEIIKQSAGIKTDYTTRNSEMGILDDKQPFIGCNHFQEGSGTCSETKAVCPVPSVVNLRVFRKRIEELKKLTASGA